jgi:hypothetical protein
MTWRRNPSNSSGVPRRFPRTIIVLVIVLVGYVLYYNLSVSFGNSYVNRDRAAQADLTVVVFNAEQLAGSLNPPSFSRIQPIKLSASGISVVSGNRQSPPSQFSKSGSPVVSVSMCLDGPQCRELIAASQGLPGRCFFERVVVGSGAISNNGLQPGYAVAATRGKRVCSAATAPSNGWSAGSRSEHSPKGK